MINYWRDHRPTVDSEKKPDKLNVVSKLDCMGIVGISLEAIADPLWARKLSPAEAERAAAYGTMELNGFPGWFEALAAAKPDEVRRVLMREVKSQIGPHSGQQHGILQDISYGSSEIAKLVAVDLLAELDGSPSISGGPLKTTVSILINGLTDPSDRQRLASLSINRFASSMDVDLAASYIYAAFSTDAVAATAALTDRLALMDPDAQSAFCKTVFPRVFGDRIFDGGIDPGLIPFSVLEHLVGIAYRTIRIEDDRHHASGEVHTLNDRDRAEGARSSLYNRLTQTPGPATVEALRRVGPICGSAWKRDPVSGVIGVE